MILKSIEMKGFKSFPHKTQLGFPDGIVSIIGPNGSGKSNVLDAVRWVLGEKSAKNLRGEKMEDVIFSGTKIHKSMNFCEVEIVFGNEDQFLNIDFSEVSIKRKAYRNGESKFYINGAACRQKDIKELLLDSGIGKEGYSIISQGRIDEIVNSNPVQRRRIFEEACKISKNRYQKEESEKKLEIVRENLERINDIYYEIEKQIKPLKTQSENAKEFLYLKSELKKSDVNRIISELVEVQSDYNTLKTLMEEKNKNLEDMEKDFSSKTEKEQELNNIVENLYQTLEKITDDKNKLIILKGNIENQINSIEVNLENSDKQSIKSTEQIKKANESIVKAKSEYDNRKEELKGFETKLEEIIRNINLLEEDEIIIKEIIKNIEKNIEDTKEELVVCRNEKNLLSTQIQQYKGQKEEELKKIADVESSTKEQEKKLIIFKEEIEESKKMYNTEKEKLDQFLKDDNEIDKKIKKHQRKIEQNQVEISDIAMSLKALESKKTIFDEMEAHYEGMSNSVKSVVKEKTLIGIVDVLANIIHVDKEYEKAIEASLGGAIQNIVTKTSDNAKQAIEFLKAKKLGRATFLPLDAVKGQELQISGEIIASSLVKVEREYENIIKQLLGRTIVVSSMDQGIKIAKIHGHKYKIVTKQGEIFSPGGAITGGAYVKSGSILSRKREINELKIIIEQENMKKNELNLEKNLELECVTKLENSKRLLQQTLDDERKNIEILKIDLIDKENRLSYEEEKLETLLKESIGIKNIQDESYKKVRILKEKEKSLEIEIENLIKNLDELLLGNKENQGKYDTLQRKIGKLREEASAYRGQLESRELLLSQSKDIYSDLKQRHQEYIEENNQLLENLEDSKGKLVQLKEQENDLAESLKDAESQEEKLRNQHTVAREKLSILKEQVKSIEQGRFMQVEQRYQIENKLTKVENIISNGSSKLLEEYDLTLEEANELKDETVNTEKSHIGKIKSSIKALGNINLDAIEEYEKVNERYNIFSTQKVDLELSLEELEKITTNIEKNMRKEFKTEFTKINDLFKITFKELFGGGEGELILADEDDILNCEIEIHAQPPGKKLKNISVMSGGEKALTAIAILFAILMTRPTPFCFLDEIDAPLDDVNIYRYNKYIKGLASETQFITITHRRGTMEASDYIYGVTMEDKGVSKIVSLRLEEAENYIEN